MLVTSHFSFSHNVFHSYIYSVRQNAALYGNGLNMFVSSIKIRYLCCKYFCFCFFFGNVQSRLFNIQRTSLFHEKQTFPYFNNPKENNLQKHCRKMKKKINPFPNKPWFLRVCNGSLLKTLWEKEKLLGTSNFFFSHSVFYPFGKLSAIFIKFEIVVW